MSKARVCLLVSIAMLSSVSAFAVDGVVLINQATVAAAGGFPYLIRQPGSYKLSGNLIVTGDSNSCNVAGSCDAIHILSDNVTIDLNGFSITGPGIFEVGFGIFSSNSALTVMNGHVTGFGDGISLSGLGEMVRGLTVSNGSLGVSIASGTISDTDVDQTAFSSTGVEGIAIASDGLVLRCHIKKTQSSTDFFSEGISIGDGLISESEVSGYFIGLGPAGSVSVINNSIHNNGRALIAQSGRTGYGSNTFLKNGFDPFAITPGAVTSMKNNVCSDGSIC